MHIDARRNTNITRTGPSLKDLLLLATLGLPLIGTAGLAGAALAPLLLQNLSRSTQAETEQAPPPSAGEDADTRTSPRIRFGPDREDVP